MSVSRLKKNICITEVQYCKQTEGNQECFIVDHPEIYTFEYCYKSKGVKNIRFYASFPEHCLRVIKTFIELGLSSEDDVMVENEKDFVEVAPLDVLTQVLKRIQQPKKYRETEILWVTISGKQGGKSVIAKMEGLIKSLTGWETSGSNINTGITAAIIAQMIKDGQIRNFGSFAPEQIIPEKLLFKYSSGYGMKVFENGSVIN